MIMYLVRRNEDTLAHHEYGVSESNYLIGIFSSEDAANLAREKAEAEAAQYDFEDEYDRCATQISIIPVELDKFYDREFQPYLGGGFYVE